MLIDLQVFIVLWTIARGTHLNVYQTWQRGKWHSQLSWKRCLLVLYVWWISSRNWSVLLMSSGPCSVTATTREGEHNFAFILSLLNDCIPVEEKANSHTTTWCNGELSICFLSARPTPAKFQFKKDYCISLNTESLKTL